MVHVWHKADDTFNYKCTLATVKVYLKILNEYAIPERIHLIGEHFVFQKVYAPIHTAKKVVEYLSE